MKEDDVISAKTEPVRLEGNVETLTGHTLFSWVRDIASPDKKLNIQAYVKNTLIGSSCADVYREDLSSAGLGGGQYGIELDDSIMDDMTRVVVVIDEDSREIVGTLEVCESNSATSSVESIETANVKGYLTLQNLSEITGFDVERCVDSISVAQSACSLNPEKQQYQFSMEVPREFGDDFFHLFSVRLIGYQTDAEPFMDKLQSVITHWKHLAHDIQTANLTSLSKISAYRYKSLQSCICKIASENQTNDALQEIM